MREKDAVGIVTFDLIGLLPTDHIIAYINKGLDRFCWQNFEQNKRILGRAFCRQNRAFLA